MQLLFGMKNSAENSLREKVTVCKVLSRAEEVWWKEQGGRHLEPVSDGSAILQARSQQVNGDASLSLPFLTCKVDGYQTGS